MAARHEVTFSKRSNLELRKKQAELNLECSFFITVCCFGSWAVFDLANGPFWSYRKFMGRFGLGRFGSCAVLVVSHYCHCGEINLLKPEIQ